MTSGTPPADGPQSQNPPDGDHPTFDTSVAHVARIYDYWLGGKDNYAVDRAVAGAKNQVGRYMPVKQTYRTHAEVIRFFSGLERAEPNLIPVQKWRPDSAAEAARPSALWGGVGRKP